MADGVTNYKTNKMNQPRKRKKISLKTSPPNFTFFFFLASFFAGA